MITNGAALHTCSPCPGVPEAARAPGRIARFSMPFSISCAVGRPGACCRTTFRRGRRCRGITGDGATAGCGTRSTRRWSQPSANRKGGSPSPVPLLLTAKASRRRQAGKNAGRTCTSRSMGTNAPSWWMSWGCSYWWWCIVRACPTARAAKCSWRNSLCGSSVSFRQTCLTSPLDAQ